MFGLELLLGSFWTNVVIGVSVLFLLYKFSIRNHDYWIKKGIPCTKTIPLFGSVLEFFTTAFHEVEMRRYQELGLVYGSYEGKNALLSVSDPKLLRKILVKDFQFFTGRRVFKSGEAIVDSMLSNASGEDWKRIRSVVTPTFSTGKIKRMIEIFKECSRSVVQNFRTAKEQGKTVDCKSLFGAFTMDVIASSAFSTKLDSHNDPENIFVLTAKQVFNRKLNVRFIILLLAPSFFKIFKISIFPPGVVKFFQKLTIDIIEERKKTGQKRNDFLQLLLDATREVAEEEKWNVNEKGDIALNYAEDDSKYIFKQVTSKHLSIDELVAQCIIFFLAGYDTTASALSFATYLMAVNQDAQDKLRAEVDKALLENDGVMTYEAIQSMKYLDNVISETLRLYPPAVRTERLADADYKVEELGITIPKGMIITIPVYAIQRDPKNFPDPERFDPDRFSVEERAKRDPYTYLPFGAGPRNCVSMRFALMEIKVCLAELIATFIIKRSPLTKVPLEFNNGQGLLQPKEIYVDMEVREDSPLVK